MRGIAAIAVDVRCVPIAVIDRRWHLVAMSDQQQQAAYDTWQTARYKAFLPLFTRVDGTTPPPDAVASGEVCHISERTSSQTFVAPFAGHIAAEAARG